MFISGVWEELWLPSAMVEKQSLTDDEAVPQKKRKSKYHPTCPESHQREKHTYTKSKHELDAM